jgi:hypothetical protein
MQQEWAARQRRCEAELREWMRCNMIVPLGKVVWIDIE